MKQRGGEQLQDYCPCPCWHWQHPWRPQVLEQLASLGQGLQELLQEQQAWQQEQAPLWARPLWNHCSPSTPAGRRGKSDISLSTKMAQSLQLPPASGEPGVRVNIVLDDKTLKDTLMFAALNMRGPPLSLHSQGPLTDAQLSLMTLDEKRHPIDVMGGTFDPHF